MSIDFHDVLGKAIKEEDAEAILALLDRAFFHEEALFEELKARATPFLDFQKEKTNDFLATEAYPIN